MTTRLERIMERIKEKANHWGNGFFFEMGKEEIETILTEELEIIEGERDHAWFQMEQMECGEIEAFMKDFLESQEPVSILECRSGWRVFIQTGWDEQAREYTGVNLAYSNECGGFKNMLMKARQNYHRWERGEYNE